MIMSREVWWKVGAFDEYFYRHWHDNVTLGFCKVGPRRDEEGASSSRVKHAAACITLEDALNYASSRRPLILLTHSKCFLIAIQKWIGEGIDLIIRTHILREILELFRKRIELGLQVFTLLVKSNHTEESSLTRWLTSGRTKAGLQKWKLYWRVYGRGRSPGQPPARLIAAPWVGWSKLGPIWW